MFAVVEIDKSLTYLNTFVPYAPYTYQTNVAMIGVFAPYLYDTFGMDTSAYNTVELNVGSVTINGITQLGATTSLADCLLYDNSFYFDYATQMLYVHPYHETNINASSVSTGTVFGFCSDTVRYFRNQLYKPIIQSIPSMSETADPLEYGIIAFSSGTIVLTNDVENGEGAFDGFEKLYGNEVRIKRGSDGDTYDDLLLVYSGYVKTYTTTTLDMTISVGDKRERLAIDYPTIVFASLTGICDDTNGTLIPDGYGTVIQVPAYPILDGAGTVKFKWGTSVTSIAQVYTLVDDVLTAVAHTGFATDGTFSLTDALCAKDATDPTKGLLKVFVTGVMRAQVNPADIIADLNTRVAEIDYTASNYDLIEWAAESASLSNVALYMEDTKSLYEWISLLQSGSNFGFRYEDKGFITLRLDNPDRTEITFDDGTDTILPVDIRNSDIPIDQNAELYASSCIIKYANNHRLKTFAQVENTSFEVAVIQEHRIKKNPAYETLLTNITDANEKALRIMTDVSVVRPIVELEIESDKYKQPRIYDIVQATVSLLTHGSSITSEWTFVIGDTELLGDASGLLGERYGITRTDVFTLDSGVRSYFGSLRGQVIGISPSTDTDSVTLRIRQRDASI